MAKKFNQLDGFDLVDELLNISTDKGELVIDEKTFLPIRGKDGIIAKAIRAMMRAYDINPKIEDYEGLDSHEDYMFCYVKDGFSKSRYDKASKLLCRYIGTTSEISNMVDRSLSCRQNRYRLFKLLFVYTKRLKEVDNMFVGSNLKISSGFLLPKVITECAYGNKVAPLVDYYRRILVLLLGDYADIKYDRNVLIRDYGYPGILTPSSDYDSDLPF